LLHDWGKDATAWKILESHVPQPDFPRRTLAVGRDQLERSWALTPGDVVNAQALAQARLVEGDASGSREVILATARRKGAPTWFTRRAAYLLAAEGEFTEAVALVLGSTPS
jgi:hypothetical protein